MQEDVEAAAIDCLTREGCELVLNEVFDCDDLNAAIKEGMRFSPRCPTLEKKPRIRPRRRC